MGKRKNLKSQVKPPATTTTKVKTQSEQVEEAPSQPQVLSQGPWTRSQISPCTDTVAHKTVPMCGYFGQMVFVQSDDIINGLGSHVQQTTLSWLSKTPWVM